MSSAESVLSDLDSISDPDFRLLGERVMAAMSRLSVPGVAVGIINGDEEHTAGFGVTSIANPQPVDADTLFQVGSITKTVTGTIVMRLVEQGKLDLDTPVRAYLPELRLADEDVAGRVTLRHLLTHTGGWVGDYFDDFGMGEDALARIVAKLVDAPQLTPLGEIWSYNNAGFYIAGRIIEVVTGQPYEQVAREMALGPLGMDMSFFFPSEVITYRVAIGHNNPYVDGKFLPKIARPYALPRTAGPAGGIISTVKDLLRYARFQLGDGTAEEGTRLLSLESMRLMQTPQVAASDGRMCGITWFMREIDGTWVLSHGGGTNGQASIFMFIPARRFGMTLLTNADRGYELNQEIISWALEHYLGLKQGELEMLERDEGQLASYVGLYTGPMVDLDLQLRDGDLVLQDIPKLALPGAELEPPLPPVRLAFCGEDLVTVLDEPMKGVRGEFLRGPDGGIRWFRIFGRVFGRQQ